MSDKNPIKAEMPLWLQFHKVSRKYMEAMTKRLGHFGVDRHYFLLIAIAESKGTLSQRELADLLDTDTTMMVGILDSLTKSGFIDRQPNPNDRRKHLIVLTPKAERAIPEFKKVIGELNQRALIGYPEQFAGHFSNLLVKMKAELEKAIEECRIKELE
jgi:MarR family transcriptional regulator, transcriptional regulator for hemolysin